MTGEEIFRNKPSSFWANVRTLSQTIGYTDRKTKRIKVPTIIEIEQAYDKLGLYTYSKEKGDSIDILFKELIKYFAYRADILNTNVRNNLMNAEEARILYEELVSKYNPQLPTPMNKQKGDKKAPAFLTGIVNTVIEAHAQGINFDPDPRLLTTFVKDGVPHRTLSRRIDGAFPKTVNPIAVWEIKEYYYTTTFGSRVADGVYETLLDGMELKDAEHETFGKTEHLLIVDAYYTWWDLGKSYLCRLIDMLNMNLVDEILFGKEVPTRLPFLVNNWVQRYKESSKSYW